MASDSQAQTLDIYWDDAWYLQEILTDKAEELLDQIRCGEETTEFGESHGGLPIEDELQRVVHLLGEFRQLKFESYGAQAQIFDKETGELRPLTEEDRASFKMELPKNDD